MGASEKLERAKKKKQGRGGRGRSGKRACKTFFNGPVLVYQLQVICVIHVNQHYRENGSRARFREIPVMWYFARMSPGFSRSKVSFYMF